MFSKIFSTRPDYFPFGKQPETTSTNDVTSSQKQNDATPTNYLNSSYNQSAQHQQTISQDPKTNPTRQDPIIV